MDGQSAGPLPADDLKSVGPAEAREVLICVDDREIDKQDVSREMQYHPAASIGEARLRAARALAIRELLLAEADRQDIGEAGPQDGESADEARIRVLVERNVTVPDATDDECRRYFDANPERMRTADSHELSHILIPAPPDDAEVRATARQHGLELAAQLAKNPGRFSALAGEHSKCPTRDEGGYLGWLGQGQAVPEFEKALSKLPVGEVPDYVIETRYGFHVVLIHARREGQALDFSACRERIANYLNEHVRRRAISQYIRVIAASHDIRGIDLEAPTDPLIQ